MANAIVSGVGLCDFAVTPYLETPHVPAWTDVPAITDVIYRQEVGETDQWLDDQLVNTYYHSQKATLQAKATYLSLAVIEQVSNNSVTPTGTGGETVPVGTDADFTPPFVAVRAKINNARDNYGNPAHIAIYFYRCEVSLPLAEVSASIGTLQSFGLNFRIYRSETDERGIVLDDPAFGRLEVNGTFAPLDPFIEVFFDPFGGALLDHNGLDIFGG